ncbi:P68 family surface lipoprotein [Candidatus Mycoplasma mahonii]|uniref:P68 family surface lipoprotein n=1 Tax=Candidatus Mycoplasma mahonii TaxID=3004105 RepID=UPI0026F2C1C7|nr:P80 family lipoprotein [Candidatus Mycoplasma mahonii]WKX02474.1 P80 family lipoprotein [Candidatus Mycoplasma mahonii]
MNKLNKSVLTLGAIGASLAPVVVAVACVGSSVDNSDIVVIKTTWAKSGPQYKALDAVVKQYNDTKKDEVGFKTVKVVHVQGGYGTILPIELKEIKNNHMKNVANLFIDYPDALGQLVSIEKELNFNIHGLSRDQFEEAFTDVNDEIGGVDKGGFYSIPFSKSTDMMTINIPVMANIIKTMSASDKITFVPGIDIEYREAVGNAPIVKPVSSITKKINEYILAAEVSESLESEELTYIENAWEEDTAGSASLTGAPMLVNDDTFKSYEKLLAFITAAQTYFSGLNGKDDSIHVMGHDAPTNMLYTMAFGKKGSDMSQFLFKKGSDPNEKGLDYLYKDAGSTEEETLKSVLGMLHPSISNGGLFINGGGSYTSTEMIKHNFAISIGSTAGYSYNFNGTNAASASVKLAKAKGTMEKGDDYKLGKYDVSFGRPLPAHLAKGAIASTIGKYNNPVYPNTYTGVLGKYDIKISEAIVSEAINTAVEATTVDAPIAGYFVEDVIGTYDRYVGGVHAFDKRKSSMYVPATSVVVKQITDAQTLQKEEVVFTTAPLKVGADDSNGVLMSQGPSIIGIKTNKVMDMASTIFIKWFFDKNNLMTKESNSPSVAEYFTKTSQYIIPYKDAFKVRNSYKEGTKIAFDAFQNANTAESGIKLFESPVDLFSGRVRKSIFDIVLRENWSGYVHSRGTKTPEEIYALIKKLTVALLR